MLTKLVFLVLLPLIVSCGGGAGSTGTGNNNAPITDRDGDGVNDNADAFPDDATETADSDVDGVGNNADVFPNDSTETVDSDGDGVGDNADDFPNDPTKTVTDTPFTGVPYDYAQFQGALDNANLQQTDLSDCVNNDINDSCSKSDVVSSGGYASYDSEYFYIDSKTGWLTFEMSGDSNRTELRFTENFLSNLSDTSYTMTAEIQPISPADSVATSADGKEITLLQVHNKGENGNTDSTVLSHPLLRIVWDGAQRTDDKTSQSYSNAYWAVIKTNAYECSDSKPNYNPLCASTDSYNRYYLADFDDNNATKFKVQVANSQLIINVDNNEKVDFDISYWSHLYNYFKAGVYNQYEDGNSVIQFKSITYSEDAYDPGTEIDTTAYDKPMNYDALATSISDLNTKISAASSGDVIALENGTYSNVNLSINTDGVIVVAETSGSVFIEGTSTIDLDGDYIIFEGFTFQNGQPADKKGAIIISGSHNRVTNCKIDSFNDNEPANSYKWVSLDNDATFGEVDHCTFTGKNTEGTLLVVWRDNTSRQDHKIYRNVFSDYQYVAAEDIDDDNNGWEVIRIGTSTESQSSSYTTVEYNYFYDVNGEIEIISNKSGHNIYHYNTFESSAGLLTLRHGNDCTVDSNYFLIDDTKGGGVRVIGEGHTITNNYIEGAKSTSNSRGGIALSSSQNSPALSGYWEVSNVTVSNNTIINSKQSLHYGSSAKENAPASATISNNLIRNNIDNDGDYDFIRVTDNSSGDALDIIAPIYSNNYFYGSSNLGLSSTPAGINLNEVALSQNANGQYFATYDSLNVGAPQLIKLDLDSAVGCDF